MKRTLFKRFFLLCIFFVVPFMYEGCSGSNPAVAPSSPIEMPAILKFVSSEGLKIDLSTISSNNLGASMEVNKSTLPENYYVGPFIRFGPIFFNTFFDEVFTPAIKSLHEIEIPTRDATTGQPTVHYQVTKPLTLRGETGPHDHNVKIDFSKFDFNNDGQLEDCSGTAASAPVCVRFWLDGEPFIAGIFVIPPTYTTDPNKPDDIGEGEFKLKATRIYGFDYLFKFTYKEQKAAFIKNVEYFFRMERNDVDLVTLLGLEDVDLWTGHAALAQLDPAPSFFKRLNIATNITGTISDPNNDLEYQDPVLKYIGQFVDGENSWGGNVFADVSNRDYFPAGTFPFDQTNICAQIDTGLTKPLGFCTYVGPNLRNILPGDLEYVTALTDADVAWPTDFPATPPF